MATLTCQKLGAWPWPETPAYNRVSGSRFKAYWSQTVDELQRELGMLGVSQGVLEVDVEGSRAIRRDGWIYEDAKVLSPRVVLRFSMADQGALVYKCDQYTDWKANVRAIRLGLEALRAVDRHGITSKREQFAGFKELPSTTGPTMTTTRAAEVIAGSGDRAAIALILSDPEMAKGAARVAVRKAHPDTGGTSEQFHIVQTARKILTAHHGQAI
jgi:hypothetical protein